MNTYSVDHEAALSVCYNTSFDVLAEDIVHAEGAAGTEELDTKLFHARHVLLRAVARLEVQDFIPYLETEGFNMEAGITAGLVLLPEAAAWESVVHTCGSP